MCQVLINPGLPFVEVTAQTRSGEAEKVHQRAVYRRLATIWAKALSLVSSYPLTGLSSAYFSSTKGRREPPAHGRTSTKHSSSPPLRPPLAWRSCTSVAEPWCVCLQDSTPKGVFLPVSIIWGRCKASVCGGGSRSKISD